MIDAGVTSCMLVSTQACWQQRRYMWFPPVGDLTRRWNYFHAAVSHHDRYIIKPQGWASAIGRKTTFLSVMGTFIPIMFLIFYFCYNYGVPTILTNTAFLLDLFSSAKLLIINFSKHRLFADHLRNETQLFHFFWSSLWNVAGFCAEKGLNASLKAEHRVITDRALTNVISCFICCRRSCEINISRANKSGFFSVKSVWYCWVVF